MCAAMLLGEPLNAQASLAAGLVNRAVAPGEVLALAQAQASKLAAKPLNSLLETKRLMKARHLPQVLAVIEEEAKEFARMLGEPSAKEAFSAFLEKRKPDFSKLA